MCPTLAHVRSIAYLKPPTTKRSHLLAPQNRFYFFPKFYSVRKLAFRLVKTPDSYCFAPPMVARESSSDAVRCRKLFRNSSLLEGLLLNSLREYGPPENYLTTSGLQHISEKNKRRKMRRSTFRFELFLPGPRGSFERPGCISGNEG